MNHILRNSISTVWKSFTSRHTILIKDTNIIIQQNNSRKFIFSLYSLIQSVIRCKCNLSGLSINNLILFTCAKGFKSLNGIQNYFYRRRLLIWSFSFPFWGAHKEEEEDYVVTTMKLAILAAQRGNYEKAEQLLHLALKSAQENRDSKAVTYIYDLMANFALQTGEFKKAEKIFIGVLKRFLQSGMSDDDNAVVDVSLKLASIHANQGDVDKATLGFKFCIETQEKKLRDLGEENVDEDTLVLWAMSQDWFARFLLSLGHYDKAKSHFKRAYDVCVKVKGPENPQTAVILNDLGSVCSLQQNYDEAIDFLNKAIDVAKLCDSEDLASFYINLGTIYMQKKIYEEAEKYCQKGNRLAAKISNEEAVKESLICLDTLKEMRPLPKLKALHIEKP